MCQQQNHQMWRNAAGFETGDHCLCKSVQARLRQSPEPEDQPFVVTSKPLQPQPPAATNSQVHAAAGFIMNI